jgi:hypothetical protein
MLGSKNRDYKTEARSIDCHMRWHTQRMNELVMSGMSKDDASRKAFNELMSMSLAEKRRMVTNLKRW